jgi:hypothetical protein
MKKFFLPVLVLLLSAACNNSSNKGELPYQSGVHKGEVKEVLQTTQYTYLFVNENDKDIWLALPKMEAKPGDVYFFKDGYEMVNFRSQELGRTFQSVFFLESVGTSAEEVMKGPVVSGNEPVKAEVRQYDLKIKKAQGGINIEELFQKKSSLNGTKVRITGKVVHYNPGIMNLNWIHLQDGTSYSGKFDLTATSTAEFQVGQIVTVEGVVVLDKDFGAGYFYDVLLNEIIIVESQTQE